MHLGWFMTCVQFMVYVVVTFCQTSLTKHSDQRVHKATGSRKHPPLRCYATIGTLSVISMGLSNTACEYLTYPTQVMFKCSKLIPVMLVGYAGPSRGGAVHGEGDGVQWRGPVVRARKLFFAPF